VRVAEAVVGALAAALVLAEVAAAAVLLEVVAEAVRVAAVVVRVVAVVVRVVEEQGDELDILSTRIVRPRLHRLLVVWSGSAGPSPANDGGSAQAANLRDAGSRSRDIDRSAAQR
jgi:hypothetical protein